MASQGDQEMGTGKPEEVEEALEEAGFGTSRLPASRHTSRHPRPGGHSATPPEGRSKKSRTCSSLQPGAPAENSKHPGGRREAGTKSEELPPRLQRQVAWRYRGLDVWRTAQEVWTATSFPPPQHRRTFLRSTQCPGQVSGDVGISTCAPPAATEPAQ